jgi:hypothetical protein
MTRSGGPARIALTAAFIMCGSFLGGCRQIGPGLLHSGILGYNEAFNRSSNEQLLLNLVRMRYRHTPYFLEVNSLTNSFSFGAGISTAGNYKNKYESNHVPFFSTANPYVNYGDRPTFSYTPLRGDKFVKQLMSPLSLETLVLLYYSGWSVDRVFRCCVQSMNGIQNAPGASGPTPGYVPEYKQFHHLAGILRDLQTEGSIELGTEPGGKGLAMLIAKNADSEKVDELVNILGLKPGRSFYGLRTGVGDPDPTKINVTTRSLMGVMFYLSQAVEAPLGDELAGKVTVTRTQQGYPFEWRMITGDVMRIRSSSMRPRSVATAVPYRGTWFYIADEDLSSKATFSLLSQLFSLQAGAVKMQVPTLTLQVGE